MDEVPENTSRQKECLMRREIKKVESPKMPEVQCDKTC